MVACVAFEGSYALDREFAGYTYKQAIYEVVMATQHGVAHFKVCINTTGKNKGKSKVFTDYDPTPLDRFDVTNTRERLELLKRHKSFFLTRKTVTANGGTFLGVPFDSTDPMWDDKRHLKASVLPDERAHDIWKRITGDLRSDAPTHTEILERAATIAGDLRSEHLYEKAIAMAEVDEGWGIF